MERGAGSRGLFGFNPLVAEVVANCISNCKNPPPDIAASGIVESVVLDFEPSTGNPKTKQGTLGFQAHSPTASNSSVRIQL